MSGRLLDRAEAAERLHVSELTVRRLTAAGDLTRYGSVCAHRGSTEDSVERSIAERRITRTTEGAMRHDRYDRERPRLAERLEAARQAETAPRERVAEIEAALRAAEERRDWPAVSRLEGELQPAREALGFASAVADALESQAAAIERDRREREAARVKAQQVAEAQSVIGQALVDERTAHGQIRGHIDAMYGHLEAAREAFRQAQEAEGAVADAQRRAIAARVTAGELAAPMRAPGANAASRATGARCGGARAREVGRPGSAARPAPGHHDLAAAGRVPADSPGRRRSGR